MKWWGIYLAIAFPTLVIISIYLTKKYAHHETTSFAAYVISVMALLTSNGILCLLPLDLLDIAETKEWLYLMWNIIKWSGMVINWFLRPLTMHYLTSGEFTVKEKLKDVAIQRLSFYIVCGGIGAILIFIMSFFRMVDKEDLTNIMFLMSQSFGLFLTAVLLGYGIVSFPRTMARRLNHEKVIEYHKIKLIISYSKYLENKKDYKLLKNIFCYLHNILRKQRNMLNYMDIIRKELAITKNDYKVCRPIGNPYVYVDPQYLVKFNQIAKLKKRNLIIAYNLYKYNLEYEYFNKERSWLNSIKLHQLAIYLIIVIVSLVGLLLLFCEFSKPSVSNHNMCPMGWIQGPVKLVFGLGLFIIMAVLVFLPLFQINISNVYNILTGHTDQISLLSLVGHILSVTPSLTYNFIILSGFAHKTLFEKIFGEILLLQTISKWFFVIVFLTSLLTLTGQYIPKKIKEKIVRRVRNEISFNDYGTLVENEAERSRMISDANSLILKNKYR